MFVVCTSWCAAAGIDLSTDESGCWQFIQVKAFRLKGSGTASENELSEDEKRTEGLMEPERARPATAVSSPPALNTERNLSPALKRQQERRDMMKLKIKEMREATLKIAIPLPQSSASTTRSPQAVTARERRSPHRTAAESARVSGPQTSRTARGVSPQRTSIDRAPLTARPVQPVSRRRTPTPEKQRE